MAGEGFIATLDAAEEYMALQQALGETLRAGFLSLAQARYSMGADRVSSLQYPALMAATARLRTTGDGQLELALAAPGDSPAPSPASHCSPSSSSSSWGAASNAAKGAGGGEGASSSHAQAATPASRVAAAAGAATASPAAADAGESLEGQLQRMRLVTAQTHNVLDQLAAKYGCGGDAAAAADGSAAAEGQAQDDEEYEEVVKPGKPLHWFGSLVAPSLRDAEGHFARALQLLVQAANAQAKLRRGADGWLARSGGGRLTASGPEQALPAAASTPSACSTGV